MSVPIIFETWSPTARPANSPFNSLSSSERIIIAVLSYVPIMVTMIFCFRQYGIRCNTRVTEPPPVPASFSVGDGNYGQRVSETSSYAAVATNPAEVSMEMVSAVDAGGTYVTAQAVYAAVPADTEAGLKLDEHDNASSVIVTEIVSNRNQVKADDLGNLFVMEEL